MTFTESNRDAIRAFRKYARLGLDRAGMDSIDIYERIMGALPSRSSALDMISVHDTMRILSAFGEAETAEAVREIYFKAWGRRPTRREIGQRVLRFSSEHFCDERTVYRRLEVARRLYTTVRSGEKRF